VSEPSGNYQRDPQGVPPKLAVSYTMAGARRTLR
jgi:hypothetical protein